MLADKASELLEVRRSRINMDIDQICSLAYCGLELLRGTSRIGWMP
jgi:hypothetical protein